MGLIDRLRRLESAGERNRAQDTAALFATSWRLDWSTAERLALRFHHLQDTTNPLEDNGRLFAKRFTPELAAALRRDPVVLESRVRELMVDAIRDWKEKLQEWEAHHV